MSASSSRTVSSHRTVSAPHTVRSGKGYRVIRRVRPSAAEVPGPGLFGRLWQRLQAMLHVTPEQWHIYQMARQMGSDGGDLRGRAVMSGERALLVFSPELSGSSRRHPQGDLP
ncbi:hypothetical protein ACI3L1_03095 [Deinococcus sp. SM5_A1]|uniref:hypothetical protein n=1 Tax=Deinococcus sp. SM5_A1 TaxID=3379094 RepID=UPI00385DEAFD